MRFRSSLLRAAFVCFVSAAAALSATSGAGASDYQVLFRSCVDRDCSEGYSPKAALVRDSQGNLFGTAASNFGGVVFELKKTGTGFEYRKIYEFCLDDFGGACLDGWGPVGGLILDTKGNLYGTTQGGGSSQFAGTVYRLSPGRHGKWAHKILYVFCATGTCADGYSPSSELTYQDAQGGAPYDGTSPLFGTTTGGGSHGNGVVFRLAFGRHATAEQVLYSFCALIDCTDGIHPSGGVAMDAHGNLYGNTDDYGANGSGGTTYALLRDGKNYSFTVLHDYCAVFGCKDGQNPAGALTIDAHGDLVGATRHGGAHGWGTVFRLARRGGVWKHTRLYSFCSDAGHGCADGMEPNGNLLVDASGDIFGTTKRSDRVPGGVVYRLQGNTQTVLYGFCSEADCQDGAVPTSGVIQDASGILYGTTSQTSGTGGTIYELMP